MIASHSANLEKATNCSQFGPRIITQLPGPIAQKVIEADNRPISPSYTRGYPIMRHMMNLESVKTYEGTMTSTD